MKTLMLVLTKKEVDVIYFQNDLRGPLSFAFHYMQVHLLTGQVLYASQAERFAAQRHSVYGKSERFSVANLGAAIRYVCLIAVRRTFELLTDWKAAAERNRDSACA